MPVEGQEEKTKHSENFNVYRVGGGRGRQEGLTPSVTVSEDGAWKEVIREGPNP